MSTDTVFALLGLCAEMSTLGMPRQFFNISKIGDCWEKIWIYCQTWQKYICCFSDVVSTEAFESSVEHQVSSSACDISLISLETAWDSRLVTACDSLWQLTCFYSIFWGGDTDSSCQLWRQAGKMSRQSKKVVAAVDELTQEEREVWMDLREITRFAHHSPMYISVICFPIFTNVDISSMLENYQHLSRQPLLCSISLRPVWGREQSIQRCKKIYKKSWWRPEIQNY